MATNYTSGEVKASNNVILAYIKTSPNNVMPWFLSPPKTIANSNALGISGGFFDIEDNSNKILSIAVRNNLPIGKDGSKNVDGSGNKNEKYARGTLIWDNYSRTFQVQVIQPYTDIAASIRNKNDYWAQGGISMCLGEKDDNTFKAQAVAKEGMPNYDGPAKRAGLVYNNSLNIWLVASQTDCTALAFRAAIKEKIGSGTLVDGIFLDGGYSVQMKCEGSPAINITTTRPLPAMLALINVS